MDLQHNRYDCKSNDEGGWQQFNRWAGLDSEHVVEIQLVLAHQYAGGAGCIGDKNCRIKQKLAHGKLGQRTCGGRSVGGELGDHNGKDKWAYQQYRLPKFPWLLVEHGSS